MTTFIALGSDNDEILTRLQVNGKSVAVGHAVRVSPCTVCVCTNEVSEYRHSKQYHHVHRYLIVALH